MKSTRLLLPIAGLLGFAFLSRADENPAPSALMKVDLVFQRGHDTDPRDHGRPVVLVAAALGVPPDVFREAFRHVHPAPAGEQPKPEDVRQNKRELLSRLAPYGVTNDRLDEVSNYYRYRRESGELWRQVDAAGYALVKSGKIVSITITEPGAGYTTPPMVSVPGVALTDYPVAILTSNTDLAKNGSIAKIELWEVGDIGGPMPGRIPPEVIKNFLENQPLHPPAPPPH